MLEACGLYWNKGLHEEARNEAQKMEGPTLHTQTMEEKISWVACPPITLQESAELLMT